jgi:hypothetical protein
MALMENWFREGARENKSGRVNFSGYFVTSTSGALVAASTDAPGFTLTKVGGQAGRYTVQLVNSKGEPVVVSPTPNTKATPGLLGFGVTVITPTNSSPAANGLAAHIRGGLATLASAGTFVIQLSRQDTGVDAEVVDGAAFIVEFSMKRSSAVP